MTFGVAFVDLNATTLDLAPVADALEGSERGDRALLAAALDVAIAAGLTASVGGAPIDFREALRRGLAVELERRRGVAPGAGEVERALAASAQARPYPDARPALELLREAGVDPWVLTNTSLDAARSALEAGGLADVAAGLVSVEQAGEIKPARAVYELALERAGVSASQAILISAHWWDLAGAAATGIRGAYVARPAKPSPAALGLDVVAEGADLLTLARRLAAA